MGSSKNYVGINILHCVGGDAYYIFYKKIIKR